MRSQQGTRPRAPARPDWPRPVRDASDSGGANRSARAAPLERAAPGRGRDAGAVAAPARHRRPHAARTRVFLLEDHLVVREGVRALLGDQHDLDIVGDAASLSEALSQPVDADVIVTDLRLHDAQGSQVVAALHNRFPSARILVLTVVDDPMEVQLTFSAGAQGYLLKEAGFDELANAVRRVANGEEYVYPRLGAVIARWGQAQGRRPHATELSPREREVLVLIARGHTNAEIAGILSVSLRTVEAHRSHIMQKLGLTTRAELVRHAGEMGLLGTSEQR